MAKLRAAALAAAIFFASAWTAPAFARDEPLVAQPSSQWHAALEDGLCHLARRFSADGANFQLILRRRAPGYGYEINVVSDTLGRRNRTPYTQYDIGKEPLRHGYSFRLKDGEWEGFGANLPANYFDSPVQQSLIVTDAFEKDFKLNLIGINSALQVMEQCLDEAVRNLGFDPVQHRSLSRMAGTTEKADEVIKDAIMRTSRVRDQLRQDSIQFIVMIDATGSATSCKAEGAANEADDVQDACRDIIRSAKFTPALDADGNAVASFLIVETSIYTRTQTIFL